MPARALLSEEAEREEREARDRLRELDGQFRERLRRRSALVDRANQLADEQESLYRQREERRRELDRTHEAHRDLGRQLAELRPARDAARRALDAALADLRAARPVGGRDAPAAPGQIKREMQELELRQQTTALPLAEENALIDHLRSLSNQLNASERDQEVRAAREAAFKAKEDAIRAARAECERILAEMRRLQDERDRMMQSLRDQLVQEGHRLAELRTKGRERAEAVERLEASARELGGLEREIGRLLAASRDRRREAQRTIAEYTRRRPTPADAAERRAEESLEELIRRGRVTLGG